jgi:hypothetical protein
MGREFIIIFMGPWSVGEKNRERQTISEKNVLVIQEIFSRAGRNFCVLNWRDQGLAI